MRLGPDDGYILPCVNGRVRGLVQFPSPYYHDQDTSFHINMMPFVMGNLSSLPESCRRYQGIIEYCLERCSSPERRKIGYLTIHESIVEADTSQRRGGLHIEAGGGGGHRKRGDPVVWGGGRLKQNHLYGGIFIASTVSNSCRVFNTLIKKSQGIVGEHGNIEHVRHLIQDVYQPIPIANEMIWITDHTPHESLPLNRRQYRQFFRLVTSTISHWYADHSTPNPFGIKPQANIVHGSKFNNTVDMVHEPLASLPF